MSCLEFASYSSNLGSNIRANLMCSSSSSGRTSNEPNDPDYIPNLAMGYGDDSLALKLSLKKKARNERRLRRSQAKDEKNIEVSSEEGTGAGEGIKIVDI